MSARGIIEQATKKAKKAYNLDKDQQYSEAVAYYLEAAEALTQAIRFERNIQVAKQLRKKAEMYVDRAKELREKIKERSRNKARETDSDNDKLASAIDDLIVTEKPNVKMKDIAGLSVAKQTLREAIVLPLMRPDLFRGARRPWKGILLFGPPGCGKTLLARATASEIEASFFNVSASSLMSKWLGESEKLVKTLFETSREKQPSIVFIDEVDAMTGSRGSEHDALRRVKNELLTSMDGLSSKEEDRIVVLGATNFPEGIDAAFRRRFERRIYIGLPDREAREGIFKYNTREVNMEPDVDYAKLAEITEGYSGADIAMICREAIMKPIRELDSIGALGDETVQARDVSMDDFMEAIQDINPSVNEREVKKYLDWAAEFGSA